MRHILNTKIKIVPRPTITRGRPITPDMFKEDKDVSTGRLPEGEILKLFNIKVLRNKEGFEYVFKDTKGKLHNITFVSVDEADEFISKWIN